MCCLSWGTGTEEGGFLLLFCAGGGKLFWSFNTSNIFENILILENTTVLHITLLWGFFFLFFFSPSGYHSFLKRTSDFLVIYPWKVWCSLQKGPHYPSVTMLPLLHCPACSLQDPRWLALPLHADFLQGQVWVCRAEMSWGSWSQLRGFSICFRLQCSAAVLFIKDNLCRHQTWTIYSTEDESPNEETSLCASKAFWSPVCAQMFVLCMEGCGSEVHGSAAVMCFGLCYLGWIPSQGWV